MRSGQTQRRPSCLALVDIDGLSALNTRYGHHVGDQVLRDLASLVGGEIRSSQLVARYGSDEFILMLYDVDENDCLTMINAIRDEFANTTRYTPEGRTFSADLRAGIARLNPAWRRPQVWLAQVEDALAQTKPTGAPRIVVSDRSSARAFDLVDGL